MSKAEFISIFELTLVSANLDIISLSLIDDDHVLITFKSNGTRKEGYPQNRVSHFYRNYSSPRLFRTSIHLSPKSLGAILLAWQYELQGE